MEICEECRGSGSRSSNRTSCPQCRGRGEFTQRQGFFELRQACPRCEGTGSVIADPCPKCKGDGRTEMNRTVTITVPAGADTGLRMLIGSEGDAGQPGAARGDLEVVIRVAEHPDFQRDGVHLLCAVPITFTQAALGTTIEVATLTGKAKLTIPRGTQSHSEFRIRNEGMPELTVDRRGTPVNSGRRGDLRVLAVVETPTNLGKHEEELLRQLAAVEHTEVTPPKKGILEKLRSLFATEGGQERREG